MQKLATDEDSARDCQEGFVTKLQLEAGMIKLERYSSGVFAMLPAMFISTLAMDFLSCSILFGVWFGLVH